MILDILLSSINSDCTTSGLRPYLKRSSFSPNEWIVLTSMCDGSFVRSSFTMSRLKARKIARLLTGISFEISTIVVVFPDPATALITMLQASFLTLSKMAFCNGDGLNGAVTCVMVGWIYTIKVRKKFQLWKLFLKYFPTT